MSESNKSSVGRKGNRKYRSQRKKDPVSEDWGGNNMEMLSHSSKTSIFPDKPSNKPTVRLQSLAQKNDYNNINNKGNKKGSTSSKNRKQNNSNNNSNNTNNNNGNKPIRTHSSDFTFKNIPDKRPNYTSIGIQTSSPMKVYIDEIFNQGFNQGLTHNRCATIPQPHSDSYSLEMVKEDTEIDEIQWNNSFGKNNSSNEGNISSNDDRKLSNASTVVGEEAFFLSRRSSSMCSNATIVNHHNHSNYSYNSSLEKQPSFNDGDSMFLEDPFLLKEPITIEDLNCRDILRLDRDITRLKSAIDEKDDEDWGNIDSVSNPPSHVTIQDNGMNRFMDMWLDYPSCCYNSLFQE